MVKGSTGAHLVIRDGHVRPTVALLPWGDVFEDYLDDIGLDLEAFATRMSGGWMFGYVEALATAGIDVMIVVFSRTVTRRTEWHPPVSPCRIIALPSPSAVQWFRRAPQPLARLAPWCATNRRDLAEVLAQYQCRAILVQEYEDVRFDVVTRMANGLPVFGVFQGGSVSPDGLARRVRRGSMRKSAGLVIASAAERSRVAAQYGANLPPLVSIGNPVDTRLWHPDARDLTREHLAVAGSERLVIWHGRVDVQIKGLDLLLKAWTHVRASEPGRGARLLLIGTGVDAERFGKMVAAEGVSGVTWINEYVLDRMRMRQLLSAGDLHVLSSRREGFPVAPMEAMACGLPVVATDVSGVRDLLGDDNSCGRVVAVNDPTALGEAMANLLADPKRLVTMGSAARERVTRLYSLEAVGRQLAALPGMPGART